MSTIVDCAHNTDVLVTDDGPYGTKSEALLAGYNAAYDWLVENHMRGWRKEGVKTRQKVNRMRREGK